MVLHAYNIKKRLSNNEENDVIPYAKLNDLYVLPQARRNGIASQLIQSAFDWAKERNLDEFILNVYEKNKTTRNLYQTLGFKDDCTISNGRIRMKRRTTKN